MQSQVYFPITLTKFGGHGEGVWIFGTYKEFFPSVAYRLKVYYLQLGEFTLTVDKEINQTLPDWTVPNSTVTPNWWDTTWGSFADWVVKAWNGWWANPINWIALFVMVALITAIIVVIFLIYVGALRLRGAARGMAK
jgi:hypothetical protein